MKKLEWVTCEETNVVHTSLWWGITTFQLAMGDRVHVMGGVGLDLEEPQVGHVSGEEDTTRSSGPCYLPTSKGRQGLTLKKPKWVTSMRGTVPSVFFAYSLRCNNAPSSAPSTRVTHSLHCITSSESQHSPPHQPESLTILTNPRQRQVPTDLLALQPPHHRHHSHPVSPATTINPSHSPQTHPRQQPRFLLTDLTRTAPPPGAQA